MEQVSDQQPAGAFYVDEEDCLGFKIFLAELELLVGSSRGKNRPDAGKALKLLQKLVVTLDRTERPEIKEYQRRCEHAVIDILLKGAPPPVRRLICDILGKLYSRGDQLPLYARVSSLQLFLGTSEAFSKDTSPDVRLGALELVASLYYSQGRSLSIGVSETAGIAAKHAIKGTDDRTRCAALRLLAAAAEGVGGTHRGAAQVQHEGLKAVEKLMKDRELRESVKMACADVIRAISAAGGAHLWVSTLYAYESARTICLNALSDPSPSVRAAYAKALAEIVIASKSSTAKNSIAAAGTKPKYQQAQEKALAAIPTQCLTTPFTEAAAGSHHYTCSALAEAWVRYLTGMRAHCDQDESLFIEPVMSLIEALKAACLEAGNVPEKGATGVEELGVGCSNGERPHAQACVLYALRTGAIEQLAEGGQRLFLERIIALLAHETESAQPAVAVVALESAALLTEALGELGPESAAALEPAITGKLSAPQQPVRLQAASALAAVSVAEQGSAARLLKTAVEGVKSAAHALNSAYEGFANHKSKPPTVPGTPRGLGSLKVKPELDALHGWAVATAALVGASVRLDLGLPTSCIRSVLALAADLIVGANESEKTEEEIQEVGSAAAKPAAGANIIDGARKEAGYILLGAICQVAPRELVQAPIRGVEDPLDLWTPALSEEAANGLTELYNSNVYYLEHSVAAELWWRCSALHSLAAYITSIEPRHIKEDIMKTLSPMLALVDRHPALSDPVRAKGGVTGPLTAAAATFQLRLLQAYASLPSPKLYRDDHEALTKLCLKAIKTAATSGSLDLLTPALKQSLDHRDDVLGPWNEGLNPTEKALLSFAGVPGGPQPSACTLGQRQGTGYAPTELSHSLFGSTDSSDELMQPGSSSMHDGGGTTSGLPRSSSRGDLLNGNFARGVAFELDHMAPFPQPLGLAAALLALHTKVLGRLIACVAAENQAAIMGSLINMARGSPADAKITDEAKLIAALAATAAVLPGVKSANSQADGAEALSAAAQALAEHLVQFAQASPAAQRAAADLYAAAARLGSDAAALQFIKSLCQEAADTASLPRRATLSLAAGSVCRTVGGLGLPAVMPVVARTLVALTNASDHSIAPWTLHALLSCATAGGPAFVPHVRETLELCQSVLLSEGIYATLGLLPAVGRLINASVAVLGPEYTLGSAAYELCRGLIVELRAPMTDTGLNLDPGDALSAALEAVLYAQMLVLFAPNAIPASHHVAVLLGTLPSKRPQLRKAAADTLRHLAERDPQAMLDQHVEDALLQALDLETDPATASQLKATLWTLCSVGASSQPSRWLALFAGMVTAVQPADIENDLLGGDGLGGGGLDQDDDDEDDDGYGGLGGGDIVAKKKNSTKPASAAASAATASRDGNSKAAKPYNTSSAATAASGKDSNSTKSHLTPRLRTRLFAARCLLRIPDLACNADPRHRDLVFAQQDRVNNGGDWLVMKLQWLVDIGFKITTGQKEALRPLGVQLLTEVLHHFGAVPDPVMEGEPLVAQYQAQLVSALRTSLVTTASPALQASGAALAAAFLDSGLAKGDAAVMNRLMGLLCDLLDEDEKEESTAAASEAYAEWVGAKARVALLEAHAHCAMLGGSEEQNKRLSKLMQAWIGLLHDFCALILLPPEVAQHHHLSVLPGSSDTYSTPAVISAIAHVLPAVHKAWPAVLEASTIILTTSTASSSTSAAVRTIVEGSQGQQRHAALLDVVLTALHSIILTGTASNSVIGLETSLKTLITAMERLTGAVCVEHGWVAVHSIADCTAELSAVLELADLPPGIPGKIATVLRQLATCAAKAAASDDDILDAEMREGLMFAAETCLELSSSPRTTTEVMTVCSTIVALVESTPAYIPLLHRALTTGVEVLGNKNSTREEIVAVVPALKAMALGALHPRSSAAAGDLPLLNNNSANNSFSRSGIISSKSDSGALPSAREVVAGFCASVEDIITSAANRKEFDRIITCLACLLPVAAALSTEDVVGIKTSSSAVNETVDKVTNGEAELAVDDNDWDDTEFTSATIDEKDDCPNNADEYIGSGTEAVVQNNVYNEAKSLDVLGRAIQQSTLSVLQSLAANNDTAIAALAVRAVNAHLQDDAPLPPTWGVQCAAAVLPSAAVSAQNLVARGADLSSNDVHDVAETLKLCLLGSQVNPTGCHEVLEVAVPLLIECAAPRLNSNSNNNSNQAVATPPMLVDAARRLLGALGTGPAAGPFRDAVASLPVDVKHRLQSALAQAPTSVGSPGGSTGAAVVGGGVEMVKKAPAIQLKTFAAIKRPTTSDF